MSFNGAGQFNLIYSWTNDAANSIPITASRMDSQEADIATGLSTCITTNGQSTTTARIPFAQGASFAQPIIYGGVTLSNSVTGTGSMVLSANPTFTGTVNATFINANGSTIGLGVIEAAAGSNAAIVAYQNGAAGGEALLCQVQDVSVNLALFRFGGSTIGSISTNSTNTAYNTSSDERLKENIADAGDAGTIIDALRVRQWDWKANGAHEAFGFVAQEEYQIYAPGVTAGDADPNTIERQWGRDDSKLVPLLVKEVQSLRTRVAALEAAKP